MVSARGYVSTVTRDQRSGYHANLHSQLFLSLNAIRVISIVSLILVFASNIMVMVFDIQAVNRFAANPIPNGNMSTPQSFDYIPGSTVPNQSAGVFWAVMNRLLILFECLFLALAEFDWPIQFFDAYFPVLGSGFGVGSMGIFQCLIGAAVLSHHIGRFALVSAFLLFSIGCVNCLAGLIFRESIKEKRSLSFWNKSKTTPLPMHSTPPSMALPGHYPSGSFSSSQMAFDEKAGSNPWNGPAALAYGKNMMLQSKLQSHPGGKCLDF
ncbi:hypothetical protein SISSUDRAFT_987318 [Sistotremastrum suecicum HHB10207 ss-3]|uniref:Uncharacterized protein n=1 Tax=Sistotremastrum suecicum HHB10207 ss-3 TaxID=1314776 RepID=A0A166CQD3_9AGAM|nr:hypothetical protein SISSUDRAFT_987318 [Sistotremastrum suecicum HHB10207 ss-3]